MKLELLNLLGEFLEKEDLLSKMSESKKLQEYGYSDIHTIAAIGDLENPNVTLLADKMHMTRGAISKITKRLMAVGLIESYRLSDNKQKLFYKLTEKGEYLYLEHAKRHELFIESDKKFLSRFSDETINEVTEFMKEFNNYLEIKINELGGSTNDD